MNEHSNIEEDLFGTDSLGLFIHTARLGSVWSGNISSDKTDLIWLAIVIHNLLQNAMVNVLQGSTKTGALTDKSRRQQLQWFEDHREKEDIEVPIPRGRLADFGTLLNRLQDGDCLYPAIQLDKKQNQDLVYLNCIRNNFVHYKGSHWLLHVDDFRLPITTALKLIDEILLHHESLIWKAGDGFHCVDGYLTIMKRNLEDL